MWWNDISDIKERLSKIEECYFHVYEIREDLDRIQDRLETLIGDDASQKRVNLAMVTLDRLADYMQNVDKLNVMINEFKGCVSIARASLPQKKTRKKVTLSP